jgi:hypothetical protein
MIVGYHINLRKYTKFSTQALADRVADLSGIWANVRDAWLEHNQDKFNQAKGQQDSGVTFESGTEWMPLTERYSAEKSWAGYDDWLMVRTGELMSDMTYGAQGSSNWSEDLSQPMSAAFGSTNEKIGWNWMKHGIYNRPAQFLDQEDRENISSEVRQWLSGDGKYSGGMDMGDMAKNQWELDKGFEWNLETV